MCAVYSVDAGQGILLTVPDKVGIRTFTAAGLALPNGVLMRRVFDEVEILWKLNKWRGYLAMEDAQFAVLLMHVACNPIDELHAHVAATWPSMDEVRARHSIFWGTDRLAQIADKYDKKSAKHAGEVSK